MTIYYIVQLESNRKFKRVWALYTNLEPARKEYLFCVDNINAERWLLIKQESRAADFIPTEAWDDSEVIEEWSNEKFIDKSGEINWKKRVIEEKKRWKELYGQTKKPPTIGGKKG